jgi:Uma2 family endonuclease
MERLGKRGTVWNQNPVVLNDLSEPQPDLAVLRRRDDFYSGSHPVPDDILLLVEVADSSVGPDRSVKIPIYGRNGIQETWLVDLERSRVEIHLDPTFHGYRTVQTFRPGDNLSPQAFPDLILTVNEIVRS